MGTVDNIFVPSSLVSHALNSSKLLDYSFFFTSKAFDYVVCEVLWHKLSRDMTSDCAHSEDSDQPGHPPAQADLSLRCALNG